MYFKPRALKKILLSSILFLIVVNSFSQTADFNTEHVQDDIGNTGGNNTTISSASDITKAIELPTTNRYTHAGRADLNAGNLEGDDMAGARVLTSANTLTYYRESGSIANPMRFNTSIWEYIGPAGGNNEFIVRGRYAVALNGTNVQTTQALTGVVNKDKCIAFITGIMNNATSDDADSSTATAYLTSANSMTVDKGSNANNVTVYITVVEFTGANWSIGFGTQGVTSDSGTITLNTDADGSSGTTFDVLDWSKGIIFTQYHAEQNQSGVNDALADVFPKVVPNASTTQIDYTFNSNHDPATGQTVFCQVLINTGLNVTRFQDTSNTADEKTVNITSAGLTDKNQAFIVGTSISSGGGTAYGRGWRNYYLKSTTQAAHWCHRSGNTMAHEMQVVDLSGLTTATSGPEINLVGNGNNIPDGKTAISATDDTDFGSVYYLNGSITKTFTIENLGTSSLDVSSITSSNALFVVSNITLPVTIASGNSVTFDVTFNSSTVSTQTSTITINNTDSNEDSYTFNVEGSGVNYCSSNGNNTNDEYIGRVQLNTIDNTSGAGTTSTGYSDFTAIFTNLILNSSHTVTVTKTWTGFSYNEGVSVWIDWNQDGDFSDAGEQVYSSSASTISPVSGSFTVPSTATLGTTRMRVSMKYNGIPTECESFSYGEVEDYSIDVTSSVSAPEINLVGNGNNIPNGNTAISTTDDTNFGNIDITSGSVSHTFTIENLGNLDLTLNDPSPYVVITGATSDFTLTANPTTPITPSGNTAFTITFNPATVGTKTATISIANNDSNEDPYTFKIQGVGYDSSSTCGVTISAFPYQQDFEGSIGDWIQDTGDDFDWTVNSGGTPTAETGPSSAENGSYYIYTETSTPNYPSKTANIESPCFDLTGTTNPRITLFYHMFGQYTDINDSNNNVNYMGTLNVDISTDGGITYTTNVWSHTGSVQNANNSSWIPLSFDLSAYIGQTVKFRIQGISANDYRSNIAIDNFTVTDKANPIYGPGGVTSNLSVWLKANEGLGYTDGQSVSLWQDQGLGADAKAHTAGQEPTFRDDAAYNVNFNPVVDFNSSLSLSPPDDYYSHDDTRGNFLQGTSGFYTEDIFLVVIPNTTINSTFGNMDMFCGDEDEFTNTEDVTGLGFGMYSVRFDNEVLSYTVGTSTKNPPYTGYGVADNSTGTNYNNIGIINTRNNISTSQQQLFYNGNNIETVQNDVSDFSNVNDSRYWIGRSKAYEAATNARIAEVITYSSRKGDASLTDERNKIQSYLAIKYGITLGSNGTSQDYVDSAGNVIWDQAANAGYNYDITGIGRDDASALNQKQSKSVNSDFDGTGQIRGLVTIGLTDISTTNSANTATFPVDKEYLTWGNNNGDLDNAPNVVNVDMSAGIAGLSTPVTFTGMERIWKVTEHGGDIPKVKVSIPKNAVRNISPPGSYLMFISDTGIFDPTADYRVMTDDGTNLSTEYDFDGTKYITFGYAPETIVVRSINFDGVQDYVDMEDALNLNPSQFTISAWIKRDPTSVNASIVSKRDVGYTEGYDFKIDAFGKLEMSWGALGVQKVTSNTVIPSNVWHHVAVIYNGSTASLYIDGVLDNSANLTAPSSTTQSFYIAAAGKNTPTAFFKGNIDEVRVWDVALSEDQLHYVMNQELEDNAGNLNGTIIPQTITKNDIASIPWSKLAGYYPMSVYTYTNTNDMSGNGNQGALRNLDTVDWQTAPLPYESQADGNWDTAGTWLNNTVQNLPNSNSIVDGSKIDWDIVETNNHVNTTRDVNVLGLKVNTNELSVNADNSLTVTHYLLINGVIDLDGESQLIQTTGSDFDNVSSGYLERDQQGEGNKFRYNDWSSPVYTATDGNGKYTTVLAALRDGTNPASPGSITYVSGYDGSLSPLTISTYWMYKYANLPDDSYSSWDHIGNTGKIYAGEGFLMKGPGNPGASDQNYVFEGKPNNGDINLTINANYDYLVGNPYPSAIDAYKFIDDNPDITGPLYFWEHYGGDTHNLADYQAGYATLSKGGGVPASAHPSVSSLGTATKTPGQYVPVSQGFFVYSSTGGTIHFKNSQRVFVKEATGTSVFMKPSKGKGSKPSSSPNNNQLKDTRPKFRIGFDAPKIDHRQILLTLDKNATDDVDRGYEAEIYEIFGDDMYWIIGDKKYVIQATNTISEDKEIPLGIQLSESGKISIKIDTLENVDEKTQLYIKDKLTGETYNIKNNNFEMDLEAGDYTDRFVLAFQPKLLTKGEETLNKEVTIFMNNANSELNIQKIADVNIQSIMLFNYLGQRIKQWKNNVNKRYLQLPIAITTGVYILRINTSDGSITKKIIIK